MKLNYEIGKEEKIQLEIYRNWFFGTFYYLVDGEKHILRSAFNPFTHFNFTLAKSFEFEIGTIRKYQIKIVHTRPLAAAGARSQKVEIFVDGELLDTYIGY